MSGGDQGAASATGSAAVPASTTHPIGSGRLNPAGLATGSVNLFWLPLGAGGRSVRWNGRVLEAAAARLGRRRPCDLYHSALEVHEGPDRFVIEMTPAWGSSAVDRGVVSEGPVATRWLGRFRTFRYEVRCWRNGAIPDVAEAVASPRVLSDDAHIARRLIERVPAFPTRTWGRDEQSTGDMWNSNSLTAWLLATTGHDMTAIAPPRNGRAPGWAAGLMVAERQGAGAPSLPP